MYPASRWIPGQYFRTDHKYRVSTIKRPDFILFSGSKEQRYGLIIDKYQSHIS
jgi:hypothetical protein